MPNNETTPSWIIDNHQIEKYNEYNKNTRNLLKKFNEIKNYTLNYNFTDYLQLILLSLNDLENVKIELNNLKINITANLERKKELIIIRNKNDLNNWNKNKKTSLAKARKWWHWPLKIISLGHWESKEYIIIKNNYSNDNYFLKQNAEFELANKILGNCSDLDEVIIKQQTEEAQNSLDEIAKELEKIRLFALCEKEKVIETIKNELDSQKLKIEKLGKQKDELQTQLVQNNGKITKLATEIENNKTQLKDLTFSNESHVNVQSKNNKKINDLIISLNNVIEKQSENIEHYKQQITDLKKENQELRDSGNESNSNSCYLEKPNFSADEVNTTGYEGCKERNIMKEFGF